MKQKLKQLYFRKKYRAELVLPTRITFSCMRDPQFQVEAHSRIGRNVTTGGTRIKLGRFVSINQKVELSSPLKIEDFSTIAKKVTFQGNTKKYDDHPCIQNRVYRELFNENPGHLEKGGIRVGNDVWIGRDALILPGVEISNGAIVGAGSIVTKDVEPFEIVGGNPASHIGWRFDEERREELQELQWWNWSLEKIQDSRDFFLNFTSKDGDK